MDFRQLKYFCMVATELSFTRAAARLHVSQPPLSHHIACLEEELGARLFERSSRSVRLTEAGKALLPHALGIFERIEEARLHVQRVVKGLEGRVVVGLTGSHFLGDLPKFIRWFQLMRPKVEVVLQEVSPAAQITSVLNAQMDLCLARGRPVEAGLTADLLWRDAPVVVLPPGHPLASKKRLQLRDLAEEDFVFFRLGYSLYAQSLFDACIAARFRPRIVQQVGEVAAVINLVAAGLGVSVIPGSAARPFADSVAVLPLSQGRGAPPLSGDVYLVRRENEKVQAVLDFASLLGDWARDPAHELRS